MGRPKKNQKGRRINIWLPPEYVAIAQQIDNLSGFIQMALRQAADIMAFDIIKQERQLKSPDPTPEQIKRFNDDHPLNELTARRENKWPKPPSSVKKPELW